MLSERIKEGSYGEVHRAQDVNTGFQYAAKKVTPSALASLISSLVRHLVQEFGPLPTPFFAARSLS